MREKSLNSLTRERVTVCAQIEDWIIDDVPVSYSTPAVTEHSVRGEA